MTSKVMFVVGDRFEAFARNEGAITLTRLLRLMTGEAGERLPERTIFVPGQGLGEDEIGRLRAEALRLGLTRHFDFRLDQGHQRADRRYTHKHKVENSVISVPCRLGENLFEMALMVDDDNELMLDHLTGQHIQGMVLIEAARQAFLAVTEYFYIDGNALHHHYFVINGMDVKYLNFVFPVETRIIYEIVEKDITDPVKLSFHARITFSQSGQDCTVVDARFTAFDAELIKKKEAQRARRALNWYSERIAQEEPLSA